MVETAVATTNRLARVARLIPSGGLRGEVYELVINQGSHHGVKEGDSFLVFGPGPDITDPDTKEILGKLEVVRGRGTVVHLQEKISTLRSTEFRGAGQTKRIITENRSRYDFVGGGRIIEEVQPASREAMPFKEPEVGDYARPI